jgi:hypothetical protein
MIETSEFSLTLSIMLADTATIPAIPLEIFISSLTLYYLNAPTTQLSECSRADHSPPISNTLTSETVWEVFIDSILILILILILI